MQTIYRFPIHLFYEPAAFKEVNKFMSGFGIEQKIGMAGDSGHTDMLLEGDKEINLNDEQIESIQHIIQAGYDKVLKDKPELEKFKLTVKKGYKL